MEIDANMNRGAVNGLPPATRAATDTQPIAQIDSAEIDSFASSNALEGALKNTPDIRAEAVAGGRDLVNSSDYPSDDTVKKLSDFLAGQFQANPD
jgi:hypothetical protein